MNPAGHTSLPPKVIELSELATVECRQEYLTRNPELLNRTTVEALAEYVRQHVRVDIAESRRAAEAALSIAEELDDPECLGRAVRAKANTLWPKGECRAASDLFEQAVACFEQAGQMSEVGRTLSSSIQPLILLGEYDRALQNAQRAGEIFTQLNDQLRLARLGVNVANIYHRQERFGKALEGYESAYRQLVLEGDQEAIGGALHNMAVCLISLNDFDRALSTYEQARQLFNEHNMPLLSLQADYNIAYLYQLRGEYSRALKGLRQAQETFFRNGNLYHAALCNLDLAEVYIELNLTEEAAVAAAGAAERFEALGMGYETARALANLGIAKQNLEPESAVDCFLRSKATFRREGHRLGEWLVDLFRAMLLLDAGELEEAERLSLGASEFFRSAGLARRALVCDLLAARIAFAGGSLGLARERCEKVLDQVKRLEAPLLHYQAFLILGEVLEASAEISQSYEAYQAARSELESLRCSLQGEELKIAFMTNKLEVYERLIRLCLRRGLRGSPAEEAFTLMEQAKCRSLMDALFGRCQPLAAADPGVPQAEGEVRRLRGELNWYYHRIEAEQLSRDGVSADRIERLWAEARVREDSLLTITREAHERDSITRGTAVATLSEIRAALDPGSVLVEYCNVNGQIFAAVLTKDTLEVAALTSIAFIKSRLRMLQLQFLRCSRGHFYDDAMAQATMRATSEHLMELHDALMTPLTPLLSGRHLILIPHGVLHQLPFHALFDGDSYLIDRFTISYAPSASIYALPPASKPRPATRSLVLGIDDGRAPWIMHEVREVAKVLPAPCMRVGSEADRKALEELGADSRVIHIATHGLFRRDNPMFSSVRLGDNSFLSVYDLYHMRLPAELIALSGCATGLNVVDAGDELMGLARGLLCAGAQTLLLTLWDVQDQSTAEFARSFYSHWAGSGQRNTAEALRAGMLEVRASYPHPYHWAPFILVGKAP